MFSEWAPKGVVWLATDRKVGLCFCFLSSHCVFTSKGEDLRTCSAMTSEQNVLSPFLNVASPYYMVTLERRRQLSSDSNLGVCRHGNRHDLIWSAEAVEVKGFILSRAKWFKNPKDQVLQCFKPKYRKESWFLPKAWKYPGSLKLKST